MKSLSWNIEGLRKNIFNLKHLISVTSADFIFLSEPNIFSHDCDNLKKHFDNNYNFYLNSEDKFDKEAPFIKNRTYGGTMSLWKTELDPHISVLPSSTTSFLPILFSPPGSPPSVHISIYLPTSGKESEFLGEISQLRATIEEIKVTYKDVLVYIRGDSNVNRNNKPRSKIFDNFCSELQLVRVPTHHNTYHHFMGDGLFDSDIDVILHSSESKYDEKIQQIFCSKDYPVVNSSHDPILSSTRISSQPSPTLQVAFAPTLEHERHKIVWNVESVLDYKSVVERKLPKIREDWYRPSSVASIRVLLDLTSAILSSCASETNKKVTLKPVTRKHQSKLPKNIRSAKNYMNAAHRNYKKALKSRSISISSARSSWITSKKYYRSICRKHIHKEDHLRDSELFSIFSSPSLLYQKIKASKSSAVRSVPFLTVGNTTYPAEQVGDGLFASISQLKKQDLTSLQSSSFYHSWSTDFRHILEMCKDRQDIPRLSVPQSSQILLRMKATVPDFWSITPLHFINAGQEGHLHFNFLLNVVISEINSSSIKELNSVLALLLHKGHGKTLTSDRAYRTISTCPVIAKALDIYIHDLFIDLWNSDQAATQYQGEGSSHELASLLITETIQHSLFSSKKPTFMLLLDARSAFDTVVVEFLIRNLYLLGMSGHSLLYLKNRLLNRVTYCDWGRRIMGPIFDEHGLEQGGCNSSDLYKIYNNNLLKKVQRSEQGIDLGDGLVVSAVGQADDVALLSNCIHSLYNLLSLTLSFCQQFNIDLCADKTKLLLITNNNSDINSKTIPINPITIDSKQISFTESAEHVGVIRSTQGNIPHICGRISAHRKALGALLFSGIAQSHRANPAASVRIEKLYAMPVLFSGVASLVLNRSEIEMIDHHYKTTLSNLLKLYPGTPTPFIYFMCGSLPAKAILHLKQLGLFIMICQLHGDPLNRRARQVLTKGKPSSKSWFIQIRDICLLYDLPHPLQLLSNPPSKQTFKKLAKAQVISYWELKLRQETSFLTSLVYFKPEYSSLAAPHPIYLTAGSNPYEVAKAVVQGRMLSGRYRTEQMARHWSSNKEGYCKGTMCSQICETLEHILLWCPSYSSTRVKLVSLWHSTAIPLVSSLVTSILNGPSLSIMQFLLDASSHPQVIRLTQNFGSEVLKTIFHLTRTWCYAVHRHRAILLGRWCS